MLSVAQADGWMARAANPIQTRAQARVRCMVPLFVTANACSRPEPALSAPPPWHQCNAKNRTCYKRGHRLLSEVIGLLNIGEAGVGVTC